MQLLKPPLLAVNFPLSFPLIRLNIGMDTHYGNPLLDWFNHINFGFIFFLGFAITAAEEHGLGGVMARSWWKYLAASTLFQSLAGVFRFAEIVPHENSLVGLLM